MHPERVYCHDGHELWLADCLVPEHVEHVMADRKADLLCLDAPYSEKTHSGHDNGVMTANRAAGFSAETTGKSDTAERRYAARVAAGLLKPRRKIDYEYWTAADVATFAGLWCPVACGWCVSITDDVLAPAWYEEFRRSDRHAFAPLPLVETGSRVRLTGDGPSNWTCWIVVARPRTRAFASWGTLPGAYIQPAERDINSLGGNDRVIGGKPRKAMVRIVSDYSRRGDLVVDPTCGAGTTNMAAKMTGRRSIGLDTSTERLEIAARRLRDSREQRALFGT